MLDGKDDRDRKWAQVGQVDKMKKKQNTRSLSIFSRLLFQIKGN